MKVAALSVHVLGTPWRDLTYVHSEEMTVSPAWVRRECSAIPRP